MPAEEQPARLNGMRPEPADGTRIRVVWAIPNLSRGGAGEMQGGPEGVILNLLRATDRTRFEAYLVLHEAAQSNLVSSVPDDIPVLSLAPAGRHLLPRTELQTRHPVPDMVRAIRLLKPDVVLSTSRMDGTSALAKPWFPPTTALVCRVANNLAGALETQRRHSSRLKVAAVGGLHRLVLRRADAVIAQSTAMRRDLMAHAGGQRCAPIVTIPNPVDVRGLNMRAAAPMSRPLRKGHPQLVSVGRLHRQKGFDLLLPAFARLLEHWPGAGLWLIGEGPDRRELEATIERLDIGRSVELLGFLDNPGPYVRAADLYVCSSRYEGFPNAMAEALAVGTPAVAPAGAAAGHDVITPETGVLIPESSVDALAAGVATVLARPGLDRNGVRSSCAHRFGMEQVARRYEAVIADAACRTDRRSPHAESGIVRDARSRWG
jgi:glycosyltransferase involved in cell wall biosynthesis